MQIETGARKKEELKGKGWGQSSSIVTNHTAVILPAGTKLKPIRRKVRYGICRENCKAALYTALADENWDNVLAAPDVQRAVCILEETIHGHMDRCMYAGQSCFCVVTQSAVDDHFLSQ